MKAKLWVIREKATGKFLNTNRNRWTNPNSLYEDLKDARFFSRKNFASNSLSQTMRRESWEKKYEIIPVTATVGWVDEDDTFDVEAYVKGKEMDE